jgi:hypothetical protein
MGPCSREEAERRVADPEHSWYRRYVRRAETYKAMNALIQGSAARHTKLWMRACWREGIVPLLQMHDALDCSVASPELAERVAQLGREAVTLEVPMQVDLKFGRSWGDAKYSWEELKPALKSKPRPKPKPTSAPTKPRPKPESKLEFEPRPEVKPRPEFKSKPESAPKPKPKPKPESKPKPRSSAANAAPNEPPRPADKKAPLSVELTKLTKVGGPLTKRISLAPDGTLKKDGSACVMVRGTAERVQIAGVTALGTLIGGLQASQAIALGALRADLPDKVEVTTEKKLINGVARPDIIARTGANIVYNGPAFALLDFDSKGMPADVAAELKRRSGFWGALLTVLPALSDAASRGVPPAPNCRAPIPAKRCLGRTGCTSTWRRRMAVTASGSSRPCTSAAGWRGSVAAGECQRCIARTLDR